MGNKHLKTRDVAAFSPLKLTTSEKLYQKEKDKKFAPPLILKRELRDLHLNYQPQLTQFLTALLAQIATTIPWTLFKNFSAGHREREGVGLLPFLPVSHTSIKYHPREGEML